MTHKIELIAILIAALTICTLLPHDTALAAEEFDRRTVKIGQFVYNPLFTVSGKGVALEVIAAAYKAVGITPEFRILPLLRAKQYLIDGTVDIFGAGGTTNFSPEEQKTHGIGTGNYFNYVLALAYYRPQLLQEQVARLEGFEELDDLRGMTFGSTEIYPGNEMLQNAGLRPIEYAVGSRDILYQQLQMLQGGRFDTTQMSMLGGLIMIQDRFSKSAADFGLTKPFVAEPLTRFYNKNNPKSVYFNQQCEEGMELIMRGGRESVYFRILESYWGKNNVPAYILQNDFKEFGVETLDLSKALSYERDENGKILNLEK